MISAAVFVAALLRSFWAPFLRKILRPIYSFCLSKIPFLAFLLRHPTFALPAHESPPQPQESIQAALTVVRSRARSLGIKTDFYEKNDIHIHVPEGATPKDGPSAGGAMAIALISVLTNIPVRADTAMTGEITLRGQILKIGGLKEKLLAAKRGGIKNVIIPKENEPDLQEIPKQITSSLNIIPVEWIDEIISIALESEPTPKLNTPKSKTSKKSTKSLQN